MPCTAKKYEASRSEMADDVDYVLTTRELGRMIKQIGINMLDLPEEDFDQLLGTSSGAADIFGVTGGVMEAALRTASELLSGEELAAIDFKEVRGIQGIKEAVVQIGDISLKVAVVHGLGNARKILDRIKAGEEFHFVEFMACPGGCIGGGGQPRPASEGVLAKRLAALYAIDHNKKLRKSHQNPYIKKIYQEYLEKPGSPKAHQLLHTHYLVRGV